MYQLLNLLKKLFPLTQKKRYLDDPYQTNQLTTTTTKTTVRKDSQWTTNQPTALQKQSPVSPRFWKRIEGMNKNKPLDAEDEVSKTLSSVKELLKGLL